MSVEGRLRELPKDQQILFLRLYYETGADRGLCEDVDVDYLNPDRAQIADTLYLQLRREGLLDEPHAQRHRNLRLLQIR